MDENDQQQPFIADTGERIADRNRRAEDALAESRGMNHLRKRTGLVAANAYDRVGGWFTNHDTEVALGVVEGAIRGLVFTGLAVGALTLLQFSVPLWVIPAGIALFATIEGASAHHDLRRHDRRQDVAAKADRMAMNAGAIEYGVPMHAEDEHIKKAQEIHENLQHRYEHLNEGDKIHPEPLNRPEQVAQASPYLEPRDHRDYPPPRSSAKPQEPLPDRGSFTSRAQQSKQQANAAGRNR